MLALSRGLIVALERLMGNWLGSGDHIADVRLGSKAAENANSKNVRYAPDNGRNQRKNGHQCRFVRFRV